MGETMKEIRKETMKETYEKMELEIISFDVEDVIRTSLEGNELPRQN